jgi:LacI family transcriptional regulator
LYNKNETVFINGFLIDMPTIRDVAKHANVSISTVSRVYNKPDLVKEKTLNRIIKVATELGYKPNFIARGLVSGKSGIVGLVVPDIVNPVFSYIALGCESELIANSITLSLYNSHERLDIENEIISLAKQNMTDGLIIVSGGYRGNTKETEGQSNEIPKVYIERIPKESNADILLIDNEQLANLVCDHLYGLGHRRIGIITGNINAYTGSSRFKAIVRRMDELGIKPKDDYVYYGDFKFEGGKEAAKSFLSQAKRPTAIISCNDLMAFGFINAVYRNNIVIPKDISIVGCNDVPNSNICFPGLTTIRVPMFELGRLAAHLLIQRIYEPSLPSRKQVLPVDLIVRDSTEKPNK